MLITLSKPYASVYGQPIISDIEDEIFKYRYFGACMECTFCKDSCCAYGADIDNKTEKRLSRHINKLQERITLPAEEWFSQETFLDSEVAGGSYRRTTAGKNGCIFKSETGRGCTIHSYALENGIPYQEIKPTICYLFPLTWSEGTLHLSEELQEGSLVCSESMESSLYPTAYRAIRDELLYLFGDSFISELDLLENRCLFTFKEHSQLDRTSLLCQRVA